MKNTQIHSLRIPAGKYGLLALASASLICQSQAAVLASYEFGTTGSFSFATTTNAAGVTGSFITDAPTGGTYEINDNLGYPTPLNPVLQVSPPNNTTTTVAQAVANDSYFTFTISPDTLTSLRFDTLTFKAGRGGGSTARGYSVRTSLDSFTSDLGSGDIPAQRPNFSNLSADLSAPAFDNITAPIEFRIYVYSPAIGNSLEFDDIILNGTVTTIPEPSISLALVLGLLSCGLVRRRK
ncbi:PEP-CTERM sorting domain-containing protein [Akkermansiaceae bacterium]|nr:PEP-CTERM sorting domain-containing protein [Akkermansiaceae bacterium]MDB4279143.1 PEP-CTERM sorting domain-containing protein [bacterium]MDA7649362.1 PEP-CTERM sorting domain-containing protein [Akkermansiaceae bacterium]MDA7862366.1 PEP-CTERM sorting domain-containing protein [Akkermansiaceae bacterium]MDB0056112.1 PEP-CTERM sorting domain-containing protein [Akkermansiaceae bacterium]